MVGLAGGMRALDASYNERESSVNTPTCVLNADFGARALQASVSRSSRRTAVRWGFYVSFSCADPKKHFCSLLPLAADRDADDEALRIREETEARREF